MIWFSLAVAICTLFMLLWLWGYVALWIQARMSQVKIRLLDLFLMKLKKVDPGLIVRSKIMTQQAGMGQIPLSAFESLYLSGGDVKRVVLAVVSARHANIPLSWDIAAEFELAGRNIYEAIRSSVIPQMIHWPDPTEDNNESSWAIAQDGVQLRVKVAVTVTTDLNHLIGGATEATMTARIGQAIVSAVGSCPSYQEILENPSILSDKILSNRLSDQTCFTIVSIDIASIQVGANVGALLRAARALSDLRVHNAAAEGRRSQAIAQLQEMRVRTRCFQAMLLFTEVDIMNAIATAFRIGLIQCQSRRLGNWTIANHQPLHA